MLGHGWATLSTKTGTKQENTAELGTTFEILEGGYTTNQKIVEEKRYGLCTNCETNRKQIAVKTEAIAELTS